MNPKKFTATTSWAKAIAELPDDTRLEVYDAIFGYAESGETGELSDAAAAAFAFIRVDIDLEIEKTIALCEKRRDSVLKRWRKDDECKTK